MTLSYFFKIRYTAFVLAVLTFSLLTSGQGVAQRLPGMNESPWFGFFSGYIKRDFDMGIDDTGKLWIYLKTNQKERVGRSRWIKSSFAIRAEDEGGKRIVRNFKQGDVFESSQKAGLDHEEVKYTAETAGGAKVEMSVKYTRKGVILDGKILDGGELSNKGKLTLVISVVVPAMYGPVYNDDDDKAKERMSDDELVFKRASDNKRVKLKTYIDVDLASEKNAKDGITELKVEMVSMEEKTLEFSSEGDGGIIYLENPKAGVKSKLWKGYNVIWEKEMSADKENPFVIEVG